MCCRILMPVSLFILFINTVYAEAPKDRDKEYRMQLSNLDTESGKIIEIYAEKPWQNTGVKLHKGEAVIISYLSGKWSVDPFREDHDANGYPGSTVDKDSYVLRFVNEGALCGKIGKAGKSFFIGNTREIIAEEDGELFLIANDDIQQEYGAGFEDNSGYLDIVIYKSPYSSAATPRTSVKKLSCKTEDDLSSKSGISMELIGNYVPIKGFTPEEACRLLINSINPASNWQLSKDGKLIYLVYQKAVEFRENHGYYITLAESYNGERKTINTYVICSNGDIYQEAKAEKGETTYRFVFSILEIPLITEEKSLRDSSDGEMSYNEAYNILAVKVYIYDNLNVHDESSLTYLYQGITEFQGVQYYNFSLCENFGSDNCKKVCDYRVSGHGNILKGIERLNSIVWDPMLVG